MVNHYSAYINSNVTVIVSVDSRTTTYGACGVTRIIWRETWRTTCGATSGGR